MTLFKFDEEISNLTDDLFCGIMLDNVDNIQAHPISQVEGNFTHDKGADENIFSYNNLINVNPCTIPSNTSHPGISSPPSTLSSCHVIESGVSMHSRRVSMYDKFSVNTPPNTTRYPLMLNSVSEDDDTNNRGRNISYHSKKSPRKLEDFKPIRFLGKGAYGEVLLVKDRITSKLYAMKQLKKAEILITDTNEDKDIDANGVPCNTLGKKILERTFAERTILSQLEHPNVVKLFYSFHDHHILYLVLQYIPGGELFFHLKERGTLDETTVAFYAAEISCALIFLHGKGIVYRDLKPENCLLNEKGHLMLTDFGLSKKSVHQIDAPIHGDPVTQLHSIIGTPEYCAPEILKGQPYTQNCDWYSLGCLTYDMLIGKPPYIGANHKVILNKILKAKSPMIPDYLSYGMKDYLNALLKKDTTKRWDVDTLWRVDGPKHKKKKAGQSKMTSYQSHFIFHKINWPAMESGELQRTTLGHIVPVITDLELAENFDTEFTKMRLDSEDLHEDGVNIEPHGQFYGRSNSISDCFKGFSFVASTSYLDRYF